MLMPFRAARVGGPELDDVEIQVPRAHSPAGCVSPLLDAERTPKTSVGRENRADRLPANLRICGTRTWSRGQPEAFSDTLWVAPGTWPKPSDGIQSSRHRSSAGSATVLDRRTRGSLRSRRFLSGTRTILSMSRTVPSGPSKIAGELHTILTRRAGIVRDTAHYRSRHNWRARAPGRVASTCTG